TRWGVPFPGRGAEGRRRRVGEVIELVGATAYAERPVGSLSGGEQQRLLIAQALVRRPKLLLLDEPLDSLDLTNQAGVAALVHARRAVRARAPACALKRRSSRGSRGTSRATCTSCSRITSWSTRSSPGRR